MFLQKSIMYIKQAKNYITHTHIYIYIDIGAEKWKEGQDWYGEILRPFATFVVDKEVYMYCTFIIGNTQIYFTKLGLCDIFISFYKFVYIGNMILKSLKDEYIY